MNEILQPLRCYDALAKLLVKRHEAIGYKNIVPLIASRTTLLPFLLTCVKTDATENLITTCTAVNYKTSVAIDIKSYMAFKFGLDDLTNPTKQYISYDGTSTIPALPQGIYYLHLASTDDEWFAGLFKVGFYTKVCTIEFTNSKSFGNLWTVAESTQIYYKATYEAYTFDQGEYSEYSEANKNDDNVDKYTYRRIDKLRVIALLGDSDALDTLQTAKICDTIYLTDEIGNRSLIEIMDVSTTEVGQSNYLTIILKYRIKENSIISVNETQVVYFFDQTGSSHSIATGELTFDGDNIQFDGDNLTFGP